MKFPFTLFLLSLLALSPVVLPEGRHFRPIDTVQLVADTATTI